MSGAGRFITLAGGEGVGKSTQARALAVALRTRGLSVIETREPGGSPGAEAIRQLLLHAPADAWGREAEALLFAAARADHVARLIRPALERGDWVICDRFVDSTRAYQGGGSGMADGDIMALHAVGSRGLLPDRTLLLQVDGAETSARRHARGSAGNDRIEGRDTAFHSAVNAAFQAMATAEPERFRTIDAAGAPDVVTARLVNALGDLLP